VVAINDSVEASGEELGGLMELLEVEALAICQNESQESEQPKIAHSHLVRGGVLDDFHAAA
jgi:hypothetical protein